MQEHFATREERHAAVEAALVILARSRSRSRTNRPRALAEQAHWRTLAIANASPQLTRFSLLIVLTLVGMYGAIALLYVGTRSLADRDELALAVVTAADTVPLDLAAQTGFATEARAVYWGRAGFPVAVLTLSSLPPAPAGEHYRWLVRHGERWSSLGVISGTAGDSTQLVGDDPALSVPPDAIEVKLETDAADVTLDSRTVLAWPGPSASDK
jgi:hypothetical protein